MAFRCDVSQRQKNAANCLYAVMIAEASLLLDHSLNPYSHVNNNITSLVNLNFKLFLFYFILVLGHIENETLRC